MRKQQATGFFFCAAVLLVCGCGELNKENTLPSGLKWFNAERLQVQNANGVFVQDGQPFSGVVFALAANGRDTVSVESFVNGKEHGEWRKYFPGGRLMERRSYKAGQKTGTYAAWWPNGRQRLLYRFENGEYEGNCREWNDRGLLISDMHYRQGYESGPQTQYYDNGKVKANYVMKDGRRYGLLGTKNCVNVSDSVFTNL